MTTMMMVSDQYYYRVMLAVVFAAIVACAFTIFGATAEPIAVSGIASGSIL